MSFGGAVKLTGEQEYRSALTKITQNLRELSSEMKVVSSAYDKHDNSAEAVSARTEALTRLLGEQRNRLQTLRAEYEAFSSAAQAQSAKHGALQQQYESEKAKLEALRGSVGEASEEYKAQEKVVAELANQLQKSASANDANEQSMSRMRIQINNAQADCKKTERSLEELGRAASDTGDDAEGAATDMDRLGDETEDAGRKAQAAQEGFTIFKGAVASLAADAVRAAVRGLKELGEAVVEVGKQSFNAYASYEQLSGGVETLFGDAADIVKENASAAYKSAGISANAYMEQATSFAATLLQGLDGDAKRAASVADLAMRDMSDNANKMGTSMASIQYAYQGLARQEYRMLDNLKLGYGGTAGEMARLINDTGVLGDAVTVTAETVKDVPFDQVIAAIHQVQEQMGITGTTALEAETTIEGSANSMKAAWQNLLVDMASDNADLGASIQTLVDSATTYAGNAVPRVKQIAEGVKTSVLHVVNEIFPQIKRKIPELRPLVETFEWFVDHKNTVAGAVKAMLAAFAATKIAGWTSAMSKAAIGVGEYLKQIVLATAATYGDAKAKALDAGASAAAATSTGVLTVAQTALNKAFAANPIGLVLTGLAALVGVIALVKSHTEKLTDAQQAVKDRAEELHEATLQRVSDWEDVIETRDKAIAGGNAEIAQTQILWRELQAITDENGRVKEGYEKRASFITGELSDALDMEIEDIDGVIGKYQELRGEIDKTIEQKRAEKILEAQAAAAGEAQAEMTKMGGTLIENRNAKQKAEAELDAARAEYSQKLSEADPNADIITRIINKVEIDKAKNALDEMQASYDKEAETLAENERLYGEYAYTVGQYEENKALMAEGAYDRISIASAQTAAAYQSAAEAEMATLQQQAQEEKVLLETLKKNRTDANAEILDGQIAAAEEELAATQDSMKDIISSHLQMLTNLNGQWDDSLGEILSVLSGKSVEFRDCGDDQVQMLVDGIAISEELPKEEMGQICKKVLGVIDDTDTRTPGVNLIRGVTSGINDPTAQGGAFAAMQRFSSRLLQIMQSTFEEHSPSEATAEMGGNLLKGLPVGMKKEERAVMAQAEAFGAGLLERMNGSLTGGVSLRAFRPPDYPEEAAAVSRTVSKYEMKNDARDDGGTTRLLGMIYDRLNGLEITLDGRKVGAAVSGRVNSSLGRRAAMESMGVV